MESGAGQGIEILTHCPAAEMREKLVYCLLYGDSDCATAGYLARKKGETCNAYCLRKKAEKGSVFEIKQIEMCIE